MNLKSTCLSMSIVAIMILGGCGSNTKTAHEDNNESLNFTNQAVQTVSEGTEGNIVLDVNQIPNVTYAIVGGEDADKFQLDPQTRVLKFKETPDYENPTDSNQDNNYIVTIQATDTQGRSVTQTFTISVVNSTENDGPVFLTDTSFKTLEEAPLDITIEAANADRYEIAGGPDQSRFIIDANGSLHFNNFLPDYEHSSDSNHDHKYEIKIKAIDSHNNSSMQDFLIEIENDPADDNSGTSTRHVYKTGQKDGPGANGTPFGDDRNFISEKIANTNNSFVVTVGERVWEDSPHSQNTKVTYKEALDYCANLNYAGKDDWRAPLRHELYEIVNHDKKPTIDASFTNIANDIYWTSQSLKNYAGDPFDTAFTVSFQNGISGPENKETKQYIRCVRGPKYQEINAISKNSQDTYKDTTTGLEWAKDMSETTWATVKQTCENLTFAGKSDWRMPNINEIHSIMPIYNEETLLDVNGDGNGDLRGPYWSSTTLDSTNAIYIENYWDADHWAVSQNELDANHTVVGRDVLDDSSEPKTADYIRGICVRGGHL